MPYRPKPRYIKKMSEIFTSAEITAEECNGEDNNHKIYPSGSREENGNYETYSSNGKCASEAADKTFHSNDTSASSENSESVRYRGKSAFDRSTSETPSEEDEAPATSSESYELVSYTSLPQFLNDNEFLLHGHRPVLNSAKECLKSVFRIHTETWNIWTHLLGSMGSAALCIYYLMYMATDWSHQIVFTIFFCGATFCLSASAAYHAFICHSETVCKAMAKLDYTGVIVLISTSFIPWLHFTFFCHYSTALAYMIFVAVLGSLSVSVALQDKFREPSFRWLRLGLFLGLAMTGVIPGVHYLFNQHNLPLSEFPISWVFAMGALYLVGGIVYAARVPERIFPGKFDITCQSHQILHICVIGGVLTCYEGAARLASIRLSRGCLADAFSGV